MAGAPSFARRMRILWREEWPALLPRLNQAFGIFLAQARNQAQAKA